MLIAPAVDMTRALMWERWPKKAQRELTETGVYLEPTPYAEEPYRITRALIEDGDRHLFGDRLIEVGCPVHIIQGVKDAEVPWRHAEALVTRLASDDVVLTLVKDGDHRLSRPEDIALIEAALARFQGSPTETACRPGDRVSLRLLRQKRRRSASDLTGCEKLEALDFVATVVGEERHLGVGFRRPRRSPSC